MFDIKPNEDGLRKVLKDWQEEVFRYLWEQLDTEVSNYHGERTLDIWDATNERLKDRSISRASVINFCNAMTEAGYMEIWTTTGKGGERGFYKPSLRAKNEKIFMESVFDWILIGFQEQYPRAVYSAVNEHYGVK